MALDADRIRKTTKKLRKFMKRIPKRPTPEQVHDLRTHIRRLEATFEAVDPNPRRRDRSLLRDLARIRKHAGKVRDMDVLTADAASLDASNEQDCLVQLLQYLGAQRYGHARRLHKAVTQDASKLKRRLKNVSARLQKRVVQPSNDSGNRESTTPPESVAATLRLSASLNEPKTLNAKNLHPYRLKVKELRDILRLADKPSDKEFIDTLGQVKDAVGDWHDWEELVSIAASVLDHGSNCKLVVELKNVTGDKYEHALSAAVNMRKQFLHARNKKEPNLAVVAIAKMAS